MRDASLPLTIIGAHQDSANYLFPLLPAPGADDDMSGSTSILEAFRALAGRGYIPEHGPVEFHWYAAEEAGLLGSQEIVAYKKGLGAKVGAMMEFVSGFRVDLSDLNPRMVVIFITVVDCQTAQDMTAFVARNTTPSIFFIDSQADSALTQWVVDLANEYCDIPAGISTLK